MNYVLFSVSFFAHWNQSNQQSKQSEMREIVFDCEYEWAQSESACLIQRLRSEWAQRKQWTKRVIVWVSAASEYMNVPMSRRRISLKLMNEWMNEWTEFTHISHSISFTNSSTESNQSNQLLSVVRSSLVLSSYSLATLAHHDSITHQSAIYAWCDLCSLRCANQSAQYLWLIHLLAQSWVFDASTHIK